MPDPRPSSELPTAPLAASGDLPTVKAGMPGPVTVATRVAQPSPQRDGDPPPKLGQFLLQRRLGQGGMGQVWLARHERLGREVALKLLRPQVVMDKEFSERFLRESRAMAAVSHPNVVGILDAGEVGGYLFMALELVPGGDLLKKLKLRGGHLAEREALELISACCAGLEAIHAAGLVHRDIKPANIFLDREGRPKIGDLGLARHTSGEDRMTMTGTSWGTPAYMSPEQINGRGDIDIRADLYALGATLFMLLTGEEPFRGPTSYAVTHLALTEPAPDVRSLNRTLGAATSAIVRCCLEKDRERRYPSPAALRLDIDRALQGLPLAHAQVVGGGPVAAPAGPAHPPPSSVPLAGGDAWLTPERARLVGWGIALLLFALVAWGVSRSLATPEDVPPATGAVRAPAGRGGPLTHSRDQQGARLSCLVAGQALHLRWIPPGSFLMGSQPEEAGREAHETRHEVQLSRGFWLAETETTQALYRAVMGQNPSRFRNDEQPVDSITYHDAERFIDELNRLVPALQARLPTEAEWECACRAGSEEAYHPGSEAPIEDEWIARGAVAGPRPAGLGPANAFGLHDLHGNLLEWCADYWDGVTPLPEQPETDPLHREAGNQQICRGGSWKLSAPAARCAARLAVPADQARDDLGVRIASDAEAPR